MAKEYKQEILENGRNFGFKSANLMFLKEALGGASGDGIKVGVPEFVPVSAQDILKHLNLHTPEWTKAWEEFKTAQGDAKILLEAAKNASLKLQNIIKQSFIDHQFTTTETFDSDLMVRSTGREDSTTMSNPGGNASLPSKSDPRSISTAIGEVIASYFAEKSLSQRLAANDDILKDPFMPVLIQKMVGETDGNMVYSGVIYTGENGAVRLQAAPGHGELVVNSKGNIDDYYVSKAGVIYSEINTEKLFRIKSEFAGDKLVLKEIDNDSKQKSSASLPPEVVKKLHDVALLIEQKYGMKMDIEFVYNPAEKTINIVQARALPEGDAFGLKPLALSPEYLTKIEAEGGKKLKGNTVTPDLKTAVIITDSDQIFVTNTIEEALSSFLSGNKFSAVIVKKSAPSTSHEAGEFKSKNIPVIKLDDLAKSRAIIEELSQGKQIVVDPQRSSIFQIPTKYQGKDLAKEGLVAEGLFSSALSGNVTIEKYDFAASSIKTDGEITEKLGDLIAKARTGNEEASGKLFSFLFKKIHDNKVSGVKSANELSEKLELLSNHANDSAKQKDAVISILKTITALTKNGIISQEIFVQMNLTGAELLLAIDSLASLREVVDDEAISRDMSENPEIATSNYLDIFKKFEGIIISEGAKDIDSRSIFQEFARAKHAKEMSEFAKGLDGEFKDVFLSATMLKKYFINEEKANKFVEFCRTSCNTKDGAKMLAELAYNVAKLGIAPQWCNIAFGSKNLAELSKEMDAIKADKNAGIIDKLISKFTSAIPAWSNPKNFEKLLQEFTQNLKEITPLLKHDKTKSEVEQLITFKQMHDLVDALDLSIKSMEKSGEYGDKTLQAQNFQKMLLPFFGLMKVWCKDAGFSNHYVYDRDDTDNRDSNYLTMMDQSLNKTTLSEKDLSLSGKSDVSAATIDRASITPQGWGRTFQNIYTLEDAFTLIHQNLLSSISQQSFIFNNKIISNMPDLFRSIDTVALESLQSHKIKLISMNFIHPQIIFHYNIPLRDHSAKVDIKYDCDSKQTHLAFYIFGHNECNRWNLIELKAAVGLDLVSDIKIINYPHFNTNTNSVSFEVMLEKEKDLKSTLKNIDQLCTLSFESVSNEKLEFFQIKDAPIEKLQKLLEYFEGKSKYYEWNYHVSNMAIIQLAIDRNNVQEAVKSCIKNPAIIWDYLHSAKISDADTKIFTDILINNKEARSIYQVISGLKQIKKSYCDPDLAFKVLCAVDPTAEYRGAIIDLLGNKNFPLNLESYEHFLKIKSWFKSEYKAQIRKMIPQSMLKSFETRMQDNLLKELDQSNRDIIKDLIAKNNIEEAAKVCIKNPKIIIGYLKCNIRMTYRDIQDFADYIINSKEYESICNVINAFKELELLDVDKGFGLAFKALCAMNPANDNDVIMNLLLDSKDFLLNLESDKDFLQIKPWFESKYKAQVKNMLLMSEIDKDILINIAKHENSSSVRDNIFLQNVIQKGNPLLYKIFFTEVDLNKFTTESLSIILDFSKTSLKKMQKDGCTPEFFKKLTGENISYIFGDNEMYDRIDFSKLTKLDESLLNNIIKYCKTYHYESLPEISGELTEDSFKAYVDSKHQPSIDVELFPTLELRTKSYEAIGKEKQKTLHDYQEQHRELHEHDDFVVFCENGIGLTYEKAEKLWRASSGSDEVIEDLVLKYMGDHNNELPK